MNRLTTSSGKEVYPIAIGTYGVASRENPDTAQLLKTTGYKNIEPVYGNEVNEVAGLQHSLANGQNYLDTAGLYGAGYTNEVVGRALKTTEILRDDLFIAHNVWKSDYDKVPEVLKRHLGKLGVEYFDVAGPHSPHTNGWDTPAWQTTMEDFAKLKDEGLIRGVSVSNFSIEQIEEAERILGFPVTTAQAGYSALDQAEAKQKLRDYCAEKGIQFVGYQALNGGVLHDKTVQKIAENHEVSAAQVGLAFVLNEGVLPITKTTDPSHIDDNIRAVDLHLMKSEIKALRGTTEIPRAA